MGLSTVSLFKNLHISGASIRLEGETLRRFQLCLLSIAEDIIAVCEEENITYHLTGGSALGAARHGGFIPWDDDMDIDILGSDFDRFVEKFTEKHGEKYQINTCRTPGYGGCGNKIRLAGTVCRGRDDLDHDDCGFYVDVLCMENVPNFIVFRYVHAFFCYAFGFLLSCRNFYKNRDFMREMIAENPEIKRVFTFKIFIGRIVAFISVEKMATFTQKIYALCHNDRSTYVTVPAGRKHYFGEMRKRSDFVETVKCKFEGHDWCVPRDVDGYLKSMYGDWRKIPPENEREEHVVLELKFPGEGV